MKTKTANENLLSNRTFKNVIIEALTIEDLEKKVKEHEAVLKRTLTNMYQIKELTMERDSFYHVTENGRYQAVIKFNFTGFKRQANPVLEQTKKDLERLRALEARKPEESHIVINSHLERTKHLKEGKVSFEIASAEDIEEAVCSKQREIMGEITGLDHIAFYPPCRHKNSETGKITVLMKYQYQTRILDKKFDMPSNHEEPEGK